MFTSTLRLSWTVGPTLCVYVEGRKRNIEGRRATRMKMIMEKFIALQKKITEKKIAEGGSRTNESN